MTRRQLLWMAAAVPLRAQSAGLKAHTSTVLRKHLDSLLDPNGSLARLKGKAADGLTAVCYELAHESWNEPRYRRASVELADRVLAAMKKMPVGVLAIKEKEKPGEKVMGGGPPALGWYAAALGHVYRRAGGRGDDLLYVARV